MKAQVLKPDEFLIENEPDYLQKQSILPNGPTGCGMTRFMMHMVWRLTRPLIALSYHGDLAKYRLKGCVCA